MKSKANIQTGGTPPVALQRPCWAGATVITENRKANMIKADAFRDAAAMNCANHVPACNCDVCAFTKRILTAAQTLDASAAHPNDELKHGEEIKL
jgi:hypothetical protein